MRLSGLTQVESITLMTHFANSDSPIGIASQRAVFEASIAELPGQRSLSNSAATLNYQDEAVAADWTRPGICIGFKYARAWNSYILPEPTISQYLGLTYRSRDVTEEPQYGFGDFIQYSSYNGERGSLSYFQAKYSPELLVAYHLGLINFEHYEASIVMQEDGQIVEMWDTQFQGGFYGKDVTNWGPGVSLVPTPPSKGSSDPDASKRSLPTYKPWTLEDYLWNDPIVIGKNGESLWKNKVFIDYTGNPPKKPTAKKDDKLLKFKASKPSDPIGGGISEDIPEMTIAGKFPLLCSEDNLVGSKLFRVDRSVFYPAIPGTPNPRRSSIKKLFVETYTLSATTAVTVKKYPIFPIPDDVEILSASFHL